MTSSRPSITLAMLRRLADFPAREARFNAALSEASDKGADGLLRFMARYAYWNGYFGSGVATLAGMIGRSRHLFHDQREPYAALADRSVHLASFFFDAARDEFDDRSTRFRDTHRSLAQATLAGLMLVSLAADARCTRARINRICSTPRWLAALGTKVAEGYGARIASPHYRQIGRAIGFHLGSELLADREFTLIDAHLQRRHPVTRRVLRRSDFEVCGARLNCYAWIKLHSSLGSAVEADHFRWALQGAEHALAYSPPQRRAQLRDDILSGFAVFARHQDTFLRNVNQQR